MMGSRIARRLLDAGHALTGYNRTPGKAQPLLDAGMRWAGTPRAVAEAAEIVFSMVTDTAAAQAVALGEDGILAGLSPGKVYVEMSTIDPAATRALAARAAELGAQMLDAPISGAPLTVEQGQASLMVGGDRDTFERMKPILLAIGPKATYIGPSGMAVSMKLAVNISVAVQLLAYSEGVVLAEKSGIPREVAVEVLTNSVVASPLLKYRGPFVLKLPDMAWFDCAMMQKDLGLALDLGRAVAAPLPTAAATNELLTSARALGLEHEDMAAVFEVLARMAGLAPVGRSE
jgi:3-hydroxyisobutyrate dehydrogenase-like beta-hydroxyacid dehydrogenase